MLQEAPVRAIWRGFLFVRLGVGHAGGGKALI